LAGRVEGGPRLETRQAMLTSMMRMLALLLVIAGALGRERWRLAGEFTISRRSLF